MAVLCGRSVGIGGQRAHPKGVVTVSTHVGVHPAHEAAEAARELYERVLYGTAREGEQQRRAEQQANEELERRQGGVEDEQVDWPLAQAAPLVRRAEGGEERAADEQPAPI